MKWNESGFRPPLCTYRLNWARRTSWGWWDDWDDTVLQTQDSKFESWRSEAEHATSRSRRLPTILTFTRGWGRNIFVSFKPPRPGTEPRTLAWKAAVLTTTLGPPPNVPNACESIITLCAKAYPERGSSESHIEKPKRHDFQFSYFQSGSQVTRRIHRNRYIVWNFDRACPGTPPPPLTEAARCK